MDAETSRLIILKQIDVFCRNSYWITNTNITSLLMRSGTSTWHLLQENLTDKYLDHLFHHMT